MKKHPASLAVILGKLFLVSTLGADFFVAQNHPSASDDNLGTINEPWKTIRKANQSLESGDTIWIREGDYDQFIEPVNSGTPDSPIAYRNFDDEKVTISGSTYGILLNSKSHIVIVGFDFRNLDRFMWITNGSKYNTIANCMFREARLNDGITSTWSGSKIYRNSSYNWIRECHFSGYGYYTNDDKGAVLDIGNENDPQDLTSHNLIEKSEFSQGGHHVLGVYGENNVVRENYFHNEPWSIGASNADRGAVLYGNRNISLSGYIDNSKRNLIENNRIAYSSDPPDNVGAPGMQIATGYNIVRFNSFYHNNRAGIKMSLTRNYLQDIVDNKIYHNTFLHNGINTEDPVDHANSAIAFAVYSGDWVVRNNSIKNNIFYLHRIVFGSYRASLDDQIIENNWDGDSLVDPLFVDANALLGDPNNRELPDFSLQVSSSCIDGGTYLTEIDSLDGVGRSFRVKDAGYFMDGWGVPGVSGDTIRIMGSAQQGIVVEVDYGNNLIKLDRDITWQKGQGICLAYDGLAPDIGAFEHRLGSGALESPNNLVIEKLQ